MSNAPITVSRAVSSTHFCDSKAPCSAVLSFANISAQLSRFDTVHWEAVKPHTYGAIWAPTVGVCLVPRICGSCVCLSLTSWSLGLVCHPWMSSPCRGMFGETFRDNIVVCVMAWWKHTVLIAGFFTDNISDAAHLKEFIFLFECRNVKSCLYSLDCVIRTLILPTHLPSASCICSWKLNRLGQPCLSVPANKVGRDRKKGGGEFQMNLLWWVLAVRLT